VGDLRDGAVSGPADRARPGLDDAADPRLLQRLAAFDLDVVDTSVRAVDDKADPVAELVGQPLPDYATSHRLGGGAAVDGVVAGSAVFAPPCQRPIHRLDDVAALAQLAQGRLQLLGEGPDARRCLLCQPHAPQRLQAADPERAVEVSADLAGLGPHVHDAPVRLLQHGAVDARETVGRHLGLQFLP